MAEDNTTGNSESHSADTAGGTQPRRRARLFGSRRASKKDSSTPLTQHEPDAAAAADDIQAPAASGFADTTEVDVSSTLDAEAGVSSEGASIDDAVQDNAPASAAPASSAPAPSAPAASPASGPADAGSTTAPTRSTTSLLFQAPDLPPLPPLPMDEDRSSVRRRARRRSGDEERAGDDDPVETVVKVRTPREPREPELITEPQKVKGSTRLEAKKQRRRDGRDAGRRRTVITEAEFLARREAVDRRMVVRSSGGRVQIGVLEDSVLVEHYVARSQEASLIGNVYLGRVQNVLPSMEAAFVDIGRGRNAVLYSGEVDWDAAAEASKSGNQPRRIELALKAGDRVLVQVTKDPVGHKGARLTSQVSLPGRYLVYVPNGSMNGISRKLPDTERSRLKKILKAVLPDDVGVIVRTAAEGATEEQLTRDVQRLMSQWENISKRVENVQAPAMLHSEPDLLVKIVRDVFNEDFQKMLIAGDDARETIESYLAQVAPDLLERIEPYESDRDIFDEYRVSEQIEKALDRKVWLPSGGSLVIDRTEAMTVVDVNTGKFVGSGGNLEETVTKNNLEAAEEIVRQLRLRDIGGIIVVDFIDMVLETNRDLVLRRLVECLSRDRTKHQVAEVTSLGLVQMTRKKLGLGLLETFSEPCEVCAGRGVIVHHDPVAKHRAAAPAQSDRRRRGNGAGGSGASTTGGAGQSSHAPSVTGTHAITDSAKNALAQIAASTLTHVADVLAPSDNAAEADTDAAAATTDAARASERATSAPADSLAGDVSGTELPGLDSSGADSSDSDAPGSARPRRSRGGRRGGRGRGADSAEASAELNADDVPASTPGADTERTADVDESAASVDVPVAILDIPVSPHKRVEKSRDADKLLDSVLESLPAAKEPGAPRSRSRRVSTPALAGGVITNDDLRDHAVDSEHATD